MLKLKSTTKAVVTITTIFFAFNRSNFLNIFIKNDNFKKLFCWCQNFDTFKKKKIYPIKYSYYYILHWSKRKRQRKKKKSINSESLFLSHCGWLLKESESRSSLSFPGIWELVTPHPTPCTSQQRPKFTLNFPIHSCGKTMENSTQESHLRSENSVTYESPYPLYATAFSSSTRSPHHHRIAVGSFVEEYNNRVDILSFDEETLSLKSNPNLSFEHPYPPTKLMFHPNPSASAAARKSSDLLASSGDYLRLWEIRDNNSIEPLSVLNNAKTSEFCAPLTSFDWNEVSFIIDPRG